MKLDEIFNPSNLSFYRGTLNRYKEVLRLRKLSGLPIILKEWMKEDFDGSLYHVTPRSNLSSIQANGIKPISYWATGTICDYYREDIEDNGDEPIVFEVSLNKFDPTLLEPDFPGLEEPLTYTIHASEEEIWEAWEATNKSWEACLDLIGSVRYKGIMIP